ncbi:alanyl-tRNA synthetase [Bacillus oleivorans]|uniref:Alanyl-tRNA synthetase n=1 Tax=Bacillus oleivorans TaxID=1448271 RepID=A0A285D548_9BACI|nr:DHHA1 domain-containing protein [Bacillus oleivorans]SNX74932.1 alanyl-tRNA synthetase [Bacillus oleivorans]
MASKLFYQDPYIQTFRTEIVNQRQDEQGNWYVVLKETAFYPTGGGQPYDTGTLNGIKVTAVEEINGEIRHYLEQPMSNLADPVFGQIDWDRRFDHMQQHAGQHILSAAFEELFQIKTVSFHLGSEVLTIDLDTPELTEKIALQAERLANQIILENRPIETKWLTEEEVKKYPLRKELSVTDNIRLVIIPEFDYNGCGGTHPSSTGQVGSIKILKWETQRKKIRVQFVCGNRVLKQLHIKQNVLIELTQILNAPEIKAAEAASRLLEKNKELEKDLGEAQDQLLQFEAVQLLGETQTIGGNIMITKVFLNRPLKELQNMARLITEKNSEVIVVFVSKNEQQLQFVSASGGEVVLDLRRVGKEVFPLINGKGGGNSSFIQGGGEALLSPEDFIHKVLEKIREY